MYIVLVLATLTTAASSSFKLENIGDPLTTNNQYVDLGDQAVRRHRRAAGALGRTAYAGLDVLKQMLVGTKKLPPRNKCCKDFTKHGDMRQAWKDFDSIHPEDVNHFQLPGGVHGKSGEVGDRTLMVRTSGIDGKPVLEIINRHEFMKGPKQWSHQEPPIHRIIYTDMK